MRRIVFQLPSNTNARRVRPVGVCKSMEEYHAKCMEPGSPNFRKRGPCPKPGQQQKVTSTTHHKPAPQADETPRREYQSEEVHKIDREAATDNPRKWRGVKKVAVALGVTAAAVGAGYLAYKNPKVLKAIWEKLKDYAEKADEAAHIGGKVAAIGTTAVAVADRLKRDDVIDPDNAVPEKVVQQLAQDLSDDIRYREAVEDIRKNGLDADPKSIKYLHSLREKARQGIQDGSIPKEKVEAALSETDVTVPVDAFLDFFQTLGDRPEGEKGYQKTIRTPFEITDREGNVIGGRRAVIEDRERISGKKYTDRVVQAIIGNPKYHSADKSRYEELARVAQMGERPLTSDEKKFLAHGYADKIKKLLRIGDMEPNLVTEALISVNGEGAGAMRFDEFIDALKPMAPIPKKPKE